MSERYQRASDLLELTERMRTSLTGISVGEIAEHFEVSRRTAERMLAAIRRRDPELRYEMRDGQKFWRIGSGRVLRSVKLPDEVERLSRRVAELEAEVEERRKTMRTAELFLDAGLATSNVGICVLDKDFVVVWVNPALEEYFGVDATMVAGRDKRGLVRSGIREIFEESAEFERRVIAAYDDNTYIEHFDCHVLPGPNRKQRWLQHWSQPIAGGAYDGGRIEYYVDITPFRRRQKSQQQKLRSLESRVGMIERRDNLEALAGVAAKAIQNPLDALAKKAQSAIDSPGQVKPEEALGEILQMTGRIECSLNKMLALMQRNEPDFEECRLAPLLDSLVSDIRRDATHVTIEVALAISDDAKKTIVWADPTLIRTALRELAENSIQAMPEGGTLRLMAEIVDSGSHVWMAVGDTGPGIPPEQYERIFEPFHSTRSDAAGLGLANARQIARDHGGEIGIEESAGPGATLYLELPVRH